MCVALVPASPPAGHDGSKPGAAQARAAAASALRIAAKDIRCLLSRQKEGGVAVFGLVRFLAPILPKCFTLNIAPRRIPEKAGGTAKKFQCEMAPGFCFLRTLEKRILSP
jgi:hypothetical protein